MEPGNTRALLLILLLAAAAGGVWLFRDLLLPQAPPDIVPVERPAAAEPDSRAAPDPVYPVPPVDATLPDGELVPLPPLNDSDQYFRLALLDLFGKDLDRLLVEDLLIERSTATADNLLRGRVPERIRPLGRLPGEFEVDGTGGDAGYMLSTRNFERYEPLVEMLETASLTDAVDTYRRFYPLLSEAYVLLGYPDAHFNDRVVELIDTLIATPEPAGPIELVRDHVLFAYRDPELEALTSGQKLLLRMGNDNARRVKAVLRDLRDAITTLSATD